MYIYNINHHCLSTDDSPMINISWETAASRALRSSGSPSAGCLGHGSHEYYIITTILYIITIYYYHYDCRYYHCYCYCCFYYILLLVLLRVYIYICVCVRACVIIYSYIWLSCHIS